MVGRGTASRAPPRRVRAREETGCCRVRLRRKEGGHIKFGGCGRWPEGQGTGNPSGARAAAASGFSLRPASALAAAGGGRRGRGRAPEPASAGARPAPPPPRGLRGNAQPIPAAHCGLAPARAAKLRPLFAFLSSGVFSSPFPRSTPSPVLSATRLSAPHRSLLQDKFLNFDELFQRTFLKGAARARVWEELEVTRTLHPQPGRRRRGSQFHAQMWRCTLSRAHRSP